MLYQSTPRSEVSGTVYPKMVIVNLNPPLKKSAQKSLDYWFCQICLVQFNLDQLYFIWFLFGFGSGLVSKSSLWCLCSAQKCFRTGSLLGAGYLVLNSRIWIGLMVFDTPLFNFGSVSWFWRWKEHPCPLSPNLGLWRTLEVPDWGFASWYWVRYSHWSLVHPYF